MKFNYNVNHNGIYYAPGEDVPIEEEEKPVDVEKKVAVKEKTEEVTASQHRRGRPRRE